MSTHEWLGTCVAREYVSSFLPFSVLLRAHVPSTASRQISCYTTLARRGKQRLHEMSSNDRTPARDTDVVAQGGEQCVPGAGARCVRLRRVPSGSSAGASRVLVGDAGRWRCVERMLLTGVDEEVHWAGQSGNGIHVRASSSSALCVLRGVHVQWRWARRTTPA